MVLEHVRRVHASPTAGRHRYGSRKVFHELLREERRGEHPDLGHVPRCQIERLMRVDGLRGVRRGRQFGTTRPDSTADRPADLVKRDFTADAPNQLWFVDFVRHEAPLNLAVVVKGHCRMPVAAGVLKLRAA